MTVKEWLSRAVNIDKEIEALQREKEKAFSRATNHGVLFSDRVQASGGNASEATFAIYASYSLEVDKKIKEYFTAKQEILTAIECVQEAKYRRLLLYRYILGYTWATVTENLYMSNMKWVQTKMHSKALYLVTPYIDKAALK